MIDRTYDVIIPARNEAATIADVVVSARSSAGVGEVIVVDDHSEDDTARVAQQTGARVVTSHGRADKAAALATGVAASTAQTLVFFDADIVGVLPEHIEALAAPVIDDAYALVVGLVDYGVKSRFFLKLPPISGLRAMRRDIFEGVPAAKRRGFQIEIMINEVAVRRRVRTGIRVLQGCQHVTKVAKQGLVRGGAAHLKMTLELLACFRTVPLWTYPSYLSRLTVLPPVGRSPGDGQSTRAVVA